MPAFSLRSLVAKMPESPTALVCDIEGAEQYIDFTQLPASVSKIIIELHPEMIGQEPVDQILKALAAMGFAETAREAGTWLLTK